MRPHCYRLLAVGLLAAGLASACDTPEPEPTHPAAVNVVATLYPLADVTAQIGGDRVAVTTLLEPGRSPHGFSARVKHVEQLAAADLLVRMGLGIDAWADDAVARVSRRKVPVLALAGSDAFARRYGSLADEPPPATMPAGHDEPHDPAEQGHDREGPRAQQEGDHEHGQEHTHARDGAHGHDHGDWGDPHLWLDPVFMQAFAEAIAERLAEVDPDGAEGYRRRAEAYIQQLRQLDADYRRRLGEVPHKAFVTVHPAFTYVAERYGLRQMTLHGPEGSGIGIGRFDRLRRWIAEHDVGAIFTEPQFPADRLQALSRELPDLPVGMLDPLGNPNVPGYDGYLPMMRSNLDELAEKLGR